MTTLQPFKPNDLTEKKVTDAFEGALLPLEADKSEFFDDSYECYRLGDVLYALKADPLTEVMNIDAFRASFMAIHQLFTRPGTFEFYLDVFRAIWGEGVEIEFSIPDPGKLLINVSALSIQLNYFVARRIVGDQYFYDYVTTHDGDKILFQGVQGLRTQRETNALIRELAPANLWVQATLVLS